MYALCPAVAVVVEHADGRKTHVDMYIQVAVPFCGVLGFARKNTVPYLMLRAV